MFFWICRTAIRLRSACLAILYRKVIRLNSLGGKSVGEVSILIIYIINPFEVEPKGSESLIMKPYHHHHHHHSYPEAFLSTFSVSAACFLYDQLNVILQSPLVFLREFPTEIVFFPCQNYVSSPSYPNSIF